MNYAVEQRMRMIDHLLAEYGWCSRRVIMRYFGIQSACCTRDFVRYQELAPNNVTYDVSGRRYRTTEEFERIYE